MTSTPSISRLLIRAWAPVSFMLSLPRPWLLTLNLARKIKRPPEWEAKMHAYVGVRLHEYYDNRDDFGTH